MPKFSHEGTAQHFLHATMHLDSQIKGGIKSSVHFANLWDDLSDSRQLVYAVDAVTHWHYKLLKKFRKLVCFWDDEYLLFRATEMLQLLGYEPLPNIDDPEYKKGLEEFCFKYSIDDSKTIIDRGAFSEHAVAILIENSKFPRWIRKKLGAWFQGFVVEVKTRVLHYQ